MSKQVINICKRIIIENKEEALKYGIEDLYQYCYNELVESINWYYQRAYKSSNGLNLTVLTKLSTHLSGFENNFLSVLKSKNIFTIDSINTISLDKVLIRIQSFDTEQKKIELALYAISTDVELELTIGNYVVVSTQNQDETNYLNTVTLELTSELTIIRIKGKVE